MQRKAVESIEYCALLLAVRNPGVSVPGVRRTWAVGYTLRKRP